MAELLKSQYGLLTLRLNLVGSGSGSSNADDARIRFELHDVAPEHMRDSAFPPLLDLDLQPAEFGIPPGFDPASYRYSEPDYRASPRLIDALAAALSLLDAERALWLQFDSPTGYLALLPWERLLVGLGRVIIRLPYYALSPSVATDVIDIVACVSASVGSAALDVVAPLVDLRNELASAVLPRATRLHVFADAGVYARHAELDLSVASFEVHWYDPVDSVAPEGSTTGLASNWDLNGENPWFAWMSRELAFVTVESLHFIGHGSLVRDAGYFALNRDPLTTCSIDDALLLGASEIEGFATRLGAWSIGFTSPLGNVSPAAVRLLADSLAHARPGPIFVTEQTLDEDGAVTPSIYEALFSVRKVSRDHGLIAYLHPVLIADTSLASTDTLGYAFRVVSEALEPFATGVGTPAWINSTQRYLEQTAAQFFPDAGDLSSADLDAIGEGVKSALQFVSEVLATESTAAGTGETEPPIVELA